MIHGDQDLIRPHAQGAALAEATGGRLVTMPGSGHGPQARKPVEVNRLLYEFAGGTRPERRRSRRRRALFVSSPIGLGHARRDVAIAQELRRLHPDLDIDWLAQDPVTRVLEAEGERIHPASRYLANESAHMESESAEHDLHCFQAWRRMDEILVANFMVFDDVVEAEDYDLWIGDEAWELDYFLHENPKLKRAPYVWLTDFVGWLPMNGEAHLTTDYNAEMLSHIDRHPRAAGPVAVRRRPGRRRARRVRPDLPAIRDWTERHFDFPGYVTGFAPVEDRERLRARLGYRPNEAVCVVTVGGSGVGAALLRRVIAAYPLARARVPNLRMIVVAGPRIDPASLPQHPGLEVRAYVHDLYQHLAACDLAVVQGGLTTAMELTANQRPFLAFPLRHHFEQNFHVRHRLERYGAGRFMDFETDGPEAIADAIAAEIGRDVEYLEVETGGAARAAALIADLLPRTVGSGRARAVHARPVRRRGVRADPDSRAEHAVHRGPEPGRGPSERRRGGARPVDRHGDLRRRGRGGRGGRDRLFGTRVRRAALRRRGLPGLPRHQGVADARGPRSRSASRPAARTGRRSSCSC